VSYVPAQGLGRAMEIPAANDRVSDIAQLLEFCTRLVSHARPLYRDGRHAQGGHADIDSVLAKLNQLMGKLHSNGGFTGDPELQKHSAACAEVALELLAALEKVKSRGSQQRRGTVRMVLRTIMSEERLLELDQQLSQYQDKLNLHVTTIPKPQEEQTSHTHILDDTTSTLIQDIARQQDNMKVSQIPHLDLTKTLHDEIMAGNHDAHETTRHEIIQEIRLHAQKQAPSYGVTPTRRPISTIPFNKDKNFIGREKTLADIEDRLTQNHSVAIAGIGGIG